MKTLLIIFIGLMTAVIIYLIVYCITLIVNNPPNPFPFIEERKCTKPPKPLSNTFKGNSIALGYKAGFHNK